MLVPATFFVPLWAAFDLLVLAGGGVSVAGSLAVTVFWALVGSIPFALSAVAAARFRRSAALTYLLAVWIPASLLAIWGWGGEVTSIALVFGALFSLPAILLQRWQTVVASSTLTGVEEGIALLARAGFAGMVLLFMPACFVNAAAVAVTVAGAAFSGGLVLLAERERQALVAGFEADGPVTLRSSLY